MKKIGRFLFFIFCLLFSCVFFSHITIKMNRKSNNNNVDSQKRDCKPSTTKPSSLSGSFSNSMGMCVYDWQIVVFFSLSLSVVFIFILIIHHFIFFTFCVKTFCYNCPVLVLLERTRVKTEKCRLIESSFFLFGKKKSTPTADNDEKRLEIETQL